MDALDRDSRRLLKRVSRAFYLSIRVLPRGVGAAVGAAYLLARTADTIADSGALPPSERAERLAAFRRAITDGAGAWDAFAPRDFAQDGASDAERDLLASAPRVLRSLDALPPSDRRRVRAIAAELCDGMAFDLARFPPAESGEIGCLDSPEELERYAYMVAGCVGAFWTDATMAHTRALRHWDREAQIRLGIEFGKALQTVNVLRDVPADLRAGRCYLPSAWIEAVGLRPRDLLDAANARRARPALIAGIRAALRHFEAAEAYLSSIPRRCLRLRLAAAWPLLMGLATLDALARSPNWLEPKSRARVSRRWVYGMMAKSVPLATSNTALKAWIRRLRARVEDALER